MKVIFACIHNAGRSQMAAAFFNQMADTSKAQAISAGTQPAEAVHECVLTAMKQIGIDLSNTRPQLLTDDLAKEAALLVTMGCGEACPSVPGLKRDDWPLPDPKGKSDQEVCAIRDEIKTRVMRLVDDLDVKKAISQPVQVSK
jgi:protein-tyrosine-phosphatase